MSGVRVIVVWAVLKVIVVVFAASVQYVITIDQFAAMNNTVSAGISVTAFSPVFAAASTLLFGWAFPIFCLVWFSRNKVRQYVATWADR